MCATSVEDGDCNVLRLIIKRQVKLGINDFVVAWCLLLGACCLVLVAWCLLLGACCLLLGAWCLVLGAWCLLLGALATMQEKLKPNLANMKYIFALYISNTKHYYATNAVAAACPTPRYTQS